MVVKWQQGVRLHLVHPQLSANLLVSEEFTETRPRKVAMLYCIDATSAPSSGGGGTADILSKIYSGTINADGTVNNAIGLT